MFPGGEDGELAETLASTSNSDVSTKPPPRGPTTPKREDAVAEVPELQSIGPPVLPSTNESDAPRDMFEALGDLNNPASSTATMGDPTSQDKSPAAREEQGSFTMPGAPGTEQYQAAEDTPEGSESEPMEAEQIDIMQSLDEATQQAKLEEQATDLEADVDGSPKPMMLPTFPMNQLVRLPSKFKVRAAKPVWKLQLEASEGFIVTPKAPQPLEARQSIQWIIAEEDADDEAPQILVLAQQQGSGGRALRFPNRSKRQRHSNSTTLFQDLSRSSPSKYGRHEDQSPGWH